MPLYGIVVPVHTIVWLSTLTSILKLLLCVLLIWVTVRGIRKDRREGWLALPALVLVILSPFLTALTCAASAEQISSSSEVASHWAQIATIFSLAYDHDLRAAAATFSAGAAAARAVAAGD